MVNYSTGSSLPEALKNNYKQFGDFPLPLKVFSLKMPIKSMQNKILA
jgi:hypothetical protein